MENRRLSAELLREICSLLVGVEAGDDVFQTVAAELQAIRNRLAAYPPRLHEFRLQGNGEPDFSGIWEFNPFSGVANPLAPPMRVTHEEDRIIAEARFGAAYEGPPGCVHGGYVAASFDELLGHTFRLAASFAMTAKLCVRYRIPVPLHTDLHYEGRVTSVKGRKIFVKATLHEGENLLADAEGLLIRVEASRFEELAKRRNTRRLSGAFPAGDLPPDQNS